ncbi:MAG: response regulator [Kofleriaceae bacterium]
MIRRALVVDDYPDTAEVLSALLQALGCETRFVLNGRDALAVAEEFDPDLVLVDLEMPDLDGFMLASALREHELRHRALIAVSGWGGINVKFRAYWAGFDDHVVKPVGIQQLRQIVAQSSL